MRPLSLLALRLVVLLLGLRALVTPATPEPPPPAATPTVDRLAAPPTAASPNQADTGAQLYWLHCQPCHGDRAQGLTDEWRAILRERLAMYRALREQTVRRLGEARYREYDALYAFFVGLVEAGKLGGGRFSATR